MKVLVIGATGRAGQKLLEQLSRTRHDVVGLIRKPEQINLITQFVACSLVGDLELEVNEITSGFDALMFVAGSGGKNVEKVDYEGLAKIIDSCIQNEVKRFLYLSSINIDKEQEKYVEEIRQFFQQKNEAVPEKLWIMANSSNYNKYLEFKKRAEIKIIQSGINYTIFRAGLLTQEIGSEKVGITLGKLNAFGEISRDNVARCFIKSLENERT